MGTNYYAIPKVTDITKIEMKLCIDKEDFTTLRDLIPKEIHIGKSSGGWKFLFNHNGWKYYKDLESLKEFLSLNKIFDEYDREIAFEEFWEMVESKQDGIDDKEYHENWDKYNKCPITGEVMSKPTFDGIYDEYHFGLRFSRHKEFS
jgi:hypothetical protein